MTSARVFASIIRLQVLHVDGHISFVVTILDEHSIFVLLILGFVVRYTLNDVQYNEVISVSPEDIVRLRQRLTKVAGQSDVFSNKTLNWILAVHWETTKIHKDQCSVILDLFTSKTALTFCENNRLIKESKSTKISSATMKIHVFYFQLNFAAFTL